MKYNAFISYSHAADGALAPALQSALHRFARPWNRMRALRVFRDKTSLAASPELWGSIVEALGEADYFLLMASPRAATSPWVGKEVEWWLEHRSIDHMLVLLTEGDIGWDGPAGDFDWSVTTALPACLRGRLHAEPLWIDLRWARSADNLSLRHSQFRLAVLDIAAPLHGRPKDELDGEDVRQFHRTRRIRNAAVGVLAVMLVVSAVSFVVALRQRNDAIRQTRIATARQLAAQADLARERRAFELGAVLAGEGVQSLAAADARSPEVDLSMRRALADLPRTVSAIAVPADRALTFSPDATRVLATAKIGCSVVGFDVATGRQVSAAYYDNGVLRLTQDGGTAAAASPATRSFTCTGSADGRHIVTRTINGSETATVEVWDAESGRRVGAATHPSRSNATYAVSAGGRFLAVATSIERPGRPGRQDVVRVSSLPDGRDVLEVDGAKLVGFGPDGAHLATEAGLWRLPEGAGAAAVRVATWGVPHYGLAFSPSGRFVAHRAEEAGPIELRDLAAAGAKPVSVTADAGVVRAVRDDGRELILTSGAVIVWDVAREKARARSPAFAEVAAFGPQPMYLAEWPGGASASGTTPYRILAIPRGGNALGSTEPREGEEVFWIGFRSDREALVAADSPAALRIDAWDWARDARTTLRSVARGAGPTVGFTASADGRRYAVADGRRILVDDAGGERPAQALDEPDTSALVLSRSGRFLAAARPGRLRIWDTSKGAAVAELPFVGSLVDSGVSDDGAVAVAVVREESGPSRAGDPYALLRWKTSAPSNPERVALGRSTRPVGLCELRRDTAGARTALAGSIDEALRAVDPECAVGSADLVAELDEGGLTVTPRRGGGAVLRIEERDGFRLAAFSRDQAHVATVDRDGAVRVWPMRPDSLVSVACGRLPARFADDSLERRVEALCRPAAARSRGPSSADNASR